MSSHFYLAESAASASPFDPAQCPPEESANYAGITPLELSTLWAIIERAEWDVKMMRIFPVVPTSNVNERIIHEIPARVVTRLAQLTPEETSYLAQAWATTVEMSLRADEVGAIMKDLARLAVCAQETKRGFFLANRFTRQ